MNIVRVGIVGIGNIGSVHAINIYNNKIKGLKLTAVCDIDDNRVQWANEQFKDVSVYKKYEEMLASSKIDAVIIAVPHYIHCEIAIRAFEEGLHVQCEKPAGVYAKQAEAMNGAADRSKTVFSIMHNQRTNPVFYTLKNMFQNGELGSLIRVNWLVTNWYRTQEYYDSGNWRATWSGEGGGVLLNQAYHNIDLWQWICGMPDRVTSFCEYGKYHKIEVEDDVTLFAEYKEGATAVFTASTGEFPGTNRLEITGTLGKAVAENGKLFHWKKETEKSEQCVCLDITPIAEETAHIGILQNFTNAVLYGEKLIAPGIEGVNAVNIINAAYFSSWEKKSVNLPIDGDVYIENLKKKCECSIGNSLDSQAKEVFAPTDEYSKRWRINW